MKSLKCTEFLEKYTSTKAKSNLHVNKARSGWQYHVGRRWTEYGLTLAYTALPAGKIPLSEPRDIEPRGCEPHGSEPPGYLAPPGLSEV